eukprot:m51a1_g2692 hypothetical protein (258) ;mRNA; r:763305-764209
MEALSANWGFNHDPDMESRSSSAARTRRNAALASLWPLQSSAFVHEWTTADISRWLAAVGLASLVPAFASAAIDGEVLAGLTEDDLKALVAGGKLSLHIQDVCSFDPELHAAGPEAVAGVVYQNVSVSVALDAQLMRRGYRPDGQVGEPEGVPWGTPVFAVELLGCRVAAVGAGGNASMTSLFLSFRRQLIHLHALQECRSLDTLLPCLELRPEDAQQLRDACAAALAEGPRAPGSGRPSQARRLRAGADDRLHKGP